MLMQSARPLGELENPTEFIPRHIGIDEADEQPHAVGDRRGLAPRAGRRHRAARRSRARSADEAAAAGDARRRRWRNCAPSPAEPGVQAASSARATTARYTPGVILRNVLENPAWYTAYTPYQAEISQGRMEALVNFQTMVCDLTAMPIANASMLDEATAAAEAMTLAQRSVKSKSNTFVVAGDCHPQTIEVVQTRAAPLGIEVVRRQLRTRNGTQALAGDYFAALAQYPSTSGRIDDLRRRTCRRSHAKQAAVHRRRRPAGADAAGAARRMGRRHRGRHDAALRHADGLRRPACGLPGLPRRVQALAARAGWWASASTRTATRPTASRCRRASSTSAARRRRPTSARRRCCRRWSPACTRSTTGRRASSASRSAWPATPRSWRKGLEQLGYEPRASARAFDTLSLHTGEATEALVATRPCAARQPAQCTGTSTSASRWTRPPRATTSSCCGASSPSPGQALPRLRRVREGHRAADPAGAAPHQRLPHAPGVQHAPQRDRHAALHPQPVRQGPGAGPQHDPAGQLHDEAQRHQRDDPHHLAGVRARASVRAARPAARLRRTRRAAARLAVPGHRLRRHQPAAQRRLAGRVRRPAGDQGLAREPRARRIATSA